MNRTRTIAFYCGSLNKGGAERVFVNLAEYFNKKGYQVYMVTQYELENEYRISNSITRVISDLTDKELKRSRIVNFVSRLIKLRDIFLRIQPDVVLSCFGKNNMMSVVANAFTKCKVVVSVVADPKMEYYTGFMRLLAKLLFRFADGIVLQTKEAKSFFPKGIQKKAIILPNSVNAKFIKPPFEGERKKEIVAVGRLDTNKNHAMLIEAFSRIASRFPEYKVVIYGDGPERENLLQLISEKDLDTKVTLAGVVTDIENKIYESSLFVMTSDTEGMPNALLEAMSMGLPVICTDCPCGGPGEIIVHGENGYLFPVRDTNQLASLLEMCLENPSKTDEMGKNASKIQHTMDPETVNQAWEAYFIEVMEHGKRQRAV